MQQCTVCMYLCDSCINVEGKPKNTYLMYPLVG